MNETTEKKNGALRCSAVGNLTPADICGNCEYCVINQEFSENGGRPGVLLTGTMDEVKHAVTSGILFENVVVINAGRFSKMEAALKKIAEMEAGEYEEDLGCSGTYTYTASCGNCEDMIEIAKNALTAEAQNE